MSELLPLEKKRKAGAGLSATAGSNPATRNTLLPQDLEVLNNLSKRWGTKKYQTWNWLKPHLGNADCIEETAIVSRQAENARCLKEIERLMNECDYVPEDKDTLFNAKESDAIEFALKELILRLQAGEEQK